MTQEGSALCVMRCLNQVSRSGFGSTTACTTQSGSRSQTIEQVGKSRNGQAARLCHLDSALSRMPSKEKLAKKTKCALPKSRHRSPACRSPSHAAGILTSSLTFASTRRTPSLSVPAQVSFRGAGIGSQPTDVAFCPKVWIMWPPSRCRTSEWTSAAGRWS